jgi:hypothetical protein
VSHERPQGRMVIHLMLSQLGRDFGRLLHDLVDDASVLLSHLGQSQFQLLFRRWRGRLEGVVQPSPQVAMHKQLLA